MPKKINNKHKNPHDALIADIFSKETNVVLFMRNYLPTEVLEEIDLKKISIDTSQYVSEELKKYTSDIVIRTQLRKKRKNALSQVDIYILFEHKSYHDDKIFVQLLKYMYLMYQKDENEGKPSRIILPYVFYNGKKKWSIPANFVDQFHVSEGLKKYMLNFSYILFDTNNWDFDKEMKRSISKNIHLFTSIMLLKSAYEKNLDFLKKVFAFLLENDFIDINNMGNDNQFIILLEYISRTRDISTQELGDIIKETGIDGDKIMPTLAQRLEKKGLEKGIQQGILIEKGNVLIKLMQKKFGLSKKEIDLINTMQNAKKLEDAIEFLVDSDNKKDVLNKLK